MFTVYHSNQLDLLKTLTSALIARDPLADPFQQEVVLVQSPGMAQWLQMQLAEQFGIAANVAFPLPATFIWDMFTRVLPDIPKESAFSKDAMTWKLMWLLPEMLTQPAFAPLQHYLTDDGDKRKIHQLAGRVADLFDQYLVYRPQWLESWQRGERIDGLAEAQQWQAPLWARLVEYTQELGQPEWHRANLYSRFIHALEQAKTCPPGLPPRVFICGISALPPVYLEALQALGRHIDIHLMFTNPVAITGATFRITLSWLACRAASAVTTTRLVSRGCSASRMTRRACLTPKASSSSVTRCWPPGASWGAITSICCRRWKGRKRSTPLSTSRPIPCCTPFSAICWSWKTMR